MKKILIILILFISLNLSAQEIPYDKKAHFVAGAVISSGTYWVTKSITNDKKKAVIYSILLTAIVGAGNEIFISQEFDPADFGTTLMAGMIFTFTFELL